MIVTLPDEIARQLVTYALDQAPKEACGVLIRSLTNRIETFIPLPNYAPRPLEEFLVCDHCLTAMTIERPCQIVLWHSHPVTSHRPSREDLDLIHQTGLPMAILSLAHPSRTFAVYEAMDFDRRDPPIIREAFKVHLGSMETAYVPCG